MSGENNDNNQEFESPEKSTEKPVKVSFNPKPEDIKFIDPKVIYYKGFLELSEEDKASVLLGYLATSQDPEANMFMSPEEIERKLGMHKLESTRELFNIKKFSLYLMYVVAFGLLIFIIVVGYQGFKNGALMDVKSDSVNGVIEILKAIISNSN